jgi:hypothetical protein
MSRFLDPDDVKRLTGFVLPSKQLQWCRNNGVPAYLSAQNEVCIPVAAFEGRKAENDAAWSPDFSALRQQA